MTVDINGMCSYLHCVFFNIQHLCSIPLIIQRAPCRYDLSPGWDYDVTILKYLVVVELSEIECPLYNYRGWVDKRNRLYCSMQILYHILGGEGFSSSLGHTTAGVTVCLDKAAKKFQWPGVYVMYGISQLYNGVVYLFAYPKWCHTTINPLVCNKLNLKLWLATLHFRWWQMHNY